jgi:hypothetical protein
MEEEEKRPRKQNHPLNYDEAILLLKFFSLNDPIISFKSYCDTHVKVLGEQASDKRKYIQDHHGNWKKKGLPSKYNNASKYPEGLVRGVSFKLSLITKQVDDENCQRDQIQRRTSSFSKRKKFEGTAESPKMSSTATESTCNKTVAAHVDTDTAVDPVLMEFVVKNKDYFKVPPEMFHKWLVEKWGVASMPDLDEACQEEDFVFSAMWNGGGLKPFKKKKFITAVIDSTMGAGTDSLTSYYASSTYNSIITTMRTGPKEGKTGHD